jgi:hypothetical protein
MKNEEMISKEVVDHFKNLMGTSHRQAFNPASMPSIFTIALKTALMRI